MKQTAKTILKMHLDIVKKVIAQKLQNVQTEFLVHKKLFFTSIFSASLIFFHQI